MSDYKLNVYIYNLISVKQFIICLYIPNQKYASDYGKIFDVQNINFFLIRKILLHSHQRRY